MGVQILSRQRITNRYEFPIKVEISERRKRKQYRPVQNCQINNALSMKENPCCNPCSQKQTLFNSTKGLAYRMCLYTKQHCILNCHFKVPFLTQKCHIFCHNVTHMIICDLCVQTLFLIINKKIITNKSFQITHTSSIRVWNSILQTCRSFCFIYECIILANFIVQHLYIYISCILKPHMFANVRTKTCHPLYFTNNIMNSLALHRSKLYPFLICPIT